LFVSVNNKHEIYLKMLSILLLKLNLKLHSTQIIVSVFSSSSSSASSASWLFQLLLLFFLLC